MAKDWNTPIIKEFRASRGKVGGPFKGAPLLILHTRGAKSGKTHVNPVMYQDLGNHRVAVFASKGGAPTNPDWYHNLVRNPRATVELGTETFDVTATVARGDERRRIWTTQKQRYPTFAEYERKTKREIPVINLRTYRRGMNFAATTARTRTSDLFARWRANLQLSHGPCRGSDLLPPVTGIFPTDNEAILPIPDHGQRRQACFSTRRTVVYACRSASPLVKGRQQHIPVAGPVILPSDPETRTRINNRRACLTDTKRGRRVHEERCHPMPIYDRATDTSFPSCDSFRPGHPQPAIRRERQGGLPLLGA